MGIFRSTNPFDFNQVDGIIIDETAPQPNIQGVATNIAIMVGQFQRGPLTLNEVGSTGDVQAQYGNSSAYSGFNELRNKKFGRLRLIRVHATGSALATYQALATATAILRFDAKQGNGVYGNSITVKIEAGSISGKKYTITDTSVGAVLPQEVYDNIAVASITAATFAASSLVLVTVLATSSEPDNIAATPLASGLDGTAIDTDYQAAIAVAGVEAAGNIIFLDAYNSVRNGYLKAHVAATQDKMALLAGPQVQTTSAVITDVANYRDVDGRMIYCYPWVQTVLDGAPVMTLPTSWYASILSQIAPNIDPAFTDNSQFLAGVTDLQYHLTRSDYIQLRAAGISAFEFDADIGFKIKSGVVTQIANSSKIAVLRRRMADFLTVSIGRFLKSYQNAPNSRQQRDSIKGAILSFVQGLEQQGILPRDSEVKGGKAKLVDTESLNTDSSIAAGFLYVLYRQRIFSSAQFIVLQAEIGQSVVVTEQAA